MHPQGRHHAMHATSLQPFTPSRHDLLLSVGLVAFVALSWWVPASVYDNSAAYLPLHITLEILSIIGASLVFVIGWLAGAQERSLRDTVKASAFLAVALLNLGHLLSVPGMPPFVSPSSYEKGILFWLSEHLLTAGVLLWASLNPDRPLPHSRRRLVFLAPGLALVAAVYWAVLWHEGRMPDTFIPGEGPTGLKNGLELVIMAMSLAAAALYWKRHCERGDRDARLRAYGALLMGLGEVYFTQYRAVTSLTFTLGHAFYALGLFLFARTLFTTKFLRPYAALAESKAALEVSESQYRLISDNMRDLVMTHRPDGRVTFVSPSVQELLGYTAGEFMTKTFEAILHPEDLPALQARIRSLSTGQLLHPLRYRMRRKNGEYVWFETVSKPIVDRQRGIVGFQSTSRDISERMAAERQIHNLAFYDSLTGLPNRYLLQEHLHDAIRQCREGDSKLAVLFLDLDHFKSVNDSLGHPVGDLLLKGIAERLSEGLRGGDVIARMGGDEFVLLLPGIKDTQGLRHLADKLLSLVSSEMLLEGHELSLTASIGICLCPDDGVEPEVLLKNADVAMYQAKSSGRNGYRFFTQDLATDALERVSMEAHLRHALAREELALHYQPQIDLMTGEAIGAEALLRWTSQELGAVPPGRFIPVAEATGLILPIGEWILATAFRQARAWHDAGHGLRVAINLSALQFRQPNLLDVLDRLVAETGVDPGLLELEITESILMEQAAEMVERLVAIKERGFCLSIDDFGTGYSSLAYLKHFPIDRLKIDQSFVRDLLSNPADGLITQGIVALGHSLQARVIAEGVELAAQRDVLAAQGCDEIQGYLIARPMPALAFSQWLQREDALRA